MNDILITISKNIKKERLKQNLTQFELAEKAKLHNNYISLIEREHSNISIVNLQKIAIALKVDIKKLLK